MDKFQIAAAVERLIYGDEHTFDHADAVALFKALPMARGQWRDIVEVEIDVGLSSAGNVGIDNDNDRFLKSTRSAPKRVGKWELRRYPQSIVIEQMAGDESTMIIFSRQGAPLEMRRKVTGIFNVWMPRILSARCGFAIAYGRFEPWKQPT